MDPLLYKAATCGEISFLETLTANEETTYFAQLTPKKNTVLHLAAEFKQAEFFKKVCLKCNPSLIWQQNSKDETPLHVAARAGCLEIVEFFIEREFIDVQGRRHNVIRKKNRNGDTALNCAVRNGEYDVVECLLKADPDLSSFFNYSDESPLYLAASYSFLGIASLIIRLSSPSFSHSGPEGLTALHEAASNQYALKMMKELLKKRPEIIKEDDNVGWTPLHYAAASGLVKAVKLLLKYDINSPAAAYLLDHDGNSALHVAAFRGKINVIKKLTKTCPDILELTNKKAQTALHLAVLSNHALVIKYILGNPQLSARLLNEPDKDGNTPLHLAVLYYNNNHKVVEMLAKDTRININATNKEFKAPYDIFVLHFREYGFKTIRIRSLLKGSSKGRLLHHYVSHVFNEWSNRKPELKPYVLGYGEHRKQRKDSLLKFPQLFLVVATLVTTISFSASFNVPGGYITDGVAKGSPILADKATFQAFVVFITISFFSSISAVYFQRATASSEHVRARYRRFQSLALNVATVALALAFAFGVYVTQAKSNHALAIVPFVIFGCLFFIFCTCFALDPFGGGCRIEVCKQIGRYRFQMECGGPAGRLLPRFTYYIDQSRTDPDRESRGSLNTN